MYTKEQHQEVAALNCAGCRTTRHGHVYGPGHLSRRLDQTRAPAPELRGFIQIENTGCCNLKMDHTCLYVHARIHYHIPLHNARPKIYSFINILVQASQRLQG